MEMFIIGTILNTLQKNLMAFHCTDEESKNNIISNGVQYNHNIANSSSQDFGYGFYIHADLKAAKRYCDNMNRRGKESLWVIMSFQVNKDLFNLNIKEFNSYNDEFAEFVFYNRLRNDHGEYQHPFDVVSGCMSDSNPTDVMAKFGMGKIDEDQAKEYLKKSTSAKQICLSTEKACSMLTYQGWEYYNTASQNIEV